MPSRASKSVTLGRVVPEALASATNFPLRFRFPSHFEGVFGSLVFVRRRERGVLETPVHPPGALDKGDGMIGALPVLMMNLQVT